MGDGCSTHSAIPTLVYLLFYIIVTLVGDCLMLCQQQRPYLIPGGSGEQGKPETPSCKVVCVASRTCVVKELILMRLVGCWRFTSCEHLRSYQDRYWTCHSVHSCWFQKWGCQYYDLIYSVPLSWKEANRSFPWPLMLSIKLRSDKYQFCKDVGVTLLGIELLISCMGGLRSTDSSKAPG